MKRRVALVLPALSLLVLAAFTLPRAPDPGAADTPTAGASADTLRWTLLMQGNPAGEEILWRISGGPEDPDAPEVWRFRYEYNDRGRGPELEGELELEPVTGLPVRIEISGLDYLKSPVEERFRLGPPDPRTAEREAIWTNQAEDDRRSLAQPALYPPLNGSPGMEGFLARALLRAPGGCLDLLPQGRACIEDAGIRVEDARLVAISGFGFSPRHLWLDADSLYVGSAAGWLSPIRAGREALVDRLREPEDAAEERWLRELARTLPERPDGPLAIVNARVYDPDSRMVQDDMTVLVEDSRIRAVAPSHHLEVPPRAHVVDARGGTLVPGLFDMHVHVSSSQGILHVAAGVTTVRDLANDVDALLEAKRGFDEGTLIGPRVIAAGFLDGPGPFAGPTRALVSTRDEVREWIERYAELGYEQIKIYSSIDTALVPAIVEESRERGLKVSGHIPAWMTAEQAVRAGFDEIQHTNMLVLNFLGDTLDTRTPVRFSAVADRGHALDLASDSVRAFVELLVERDVVVDPTLAIFENMLLAQPGEVSVTYRAAAHRFPPQVARGFRTGGFPVPEGRDESWREERFAASFRVMRDFVRVLHDAGVRIVPGTDALPGFAYFRELEIYQEAGIDPVDILYLATLGSARVAGRDRELGSIQPSKRADLVLVDGRPDEDVSDLRRTVLVVKDGVLYDPARLYEAVGVAAETP